MDPALDNEWESLKEWYSLHVKSGLPARIARAANERHISPSEFLEQVVEEALAEQPARRPTAIPRRPKAVWTAETYAHA